MLKHIARVPQLASLLKASSSSPNMAVTVEGEWLIKLERGWSAQHALSWHFFAQLRGRNTTVRIFLNAFTQISDLQGPGKVFSVDFFMVITLHTCLQANLTSIKKPREEGKGHGLQEVT